MKLLRWLLFPFSVLYSWLMTMRNRQFDNGSKVTTHFDLPVISVGNLSMGGTGKTPVIEYLIRQLKDDFKLATVSRGYGRRTRGFRIANSEDTALTIGDEPFQFHRKFGEDVVISVGEERILAIPSVLLDHSEIEVFLLDDAYQHRKVGRDFNILLSDYNKPFYKDSVLPVGSLRESRKGAKRADSVIITKCPKLLEEEKQLIRNDVAIYTSAPVYFSEILYKEPRPIFTENEESVGKDVVLVTGLANPKSFVDMVGLNYNIVRHFSFRDHHHFRSDELTKIQKSCETHDGECSMLTTEKDMVRLLTYSDHDLFKSVSTFYIPIEFILDNDQDFKHQVLETINQNKNL